MKNLAILGSTGSIGKSTLDVVRNNRSELNVVSMTAGKNWKLLAEQAREFKPSFVAIADETCFNDLKAALADTNIRVGAGQQAVIEAVTIAGVDTVLAAIVGSAGLKPVWEAIERKHALCLANKETLVVGGALVMEAVKISPARRYVTGILNAAPIALIDSPRVVLTESAVDVEGIRNQRRTPTIIMIIEQARITPLTDAVAEKIATKSVVTSKPTIPPTIGPNTAAKNANNAARGCKAVLGIKPSGICTSVNATKRAVPIPIATTSLIEN